MANRKTGKINKLEKQKFKIMLIFLLFLNILIFYIPRVQSDGESYNIATFRPKYTGYSKGTLSTGILGTFTSQPFTREINLEAWNLKVWFDSYWMMTNVSVAMYLRWAAIDLDLDQHEVYYTPAITVWFSLDRGATWTHNRTFGQHVLACEEYWGELHLWHFILGVQLIIFQQKIHNILLQKLILKLSFIPLMTIGE